MAHADSWWLKVKRAQKHMIDIKREAGVYAGRHPYELVRVHKPESQRKVEYRVRLIEQPDPMIAVMLGDFVHNLRSALDHIIVASVPNKRRFKASFPILFDDIWARDTNGDFVIDDADRRTNFESAIAGLVPEARTLVVQVQPYHFGTDRFVWPIGIISRLENADKHRTLITVGGGVFNPIVTQSIRGETQIVPHPLGDGSYMKEGTVVGWSWKPATDMGDVRPSEVQMEYSGTAKILVQITGGGRNEPASKYELFPLMRDTIRDVRMLLRRLEPFVRR